MITMTQDGILKALEGITTLDEVGELPTKINISKIFMPKLSCQVRFAPH